VGGGHAGDLLWEGLAVGGGHVVGGGHAGDLLWEGLAVGGGHAGD
jgi:hypothetical protein